MAPIDLLVRTPEEILERLEIGDSFMREIVERGKVMYEVDHAETDDPATVSECKWGSVE